MRRNVILIFLVLFLAVPGWAEEGMWPPAQLPDIAKQLKELGLEIEPGRLTDLTDYPMNAVISLGGCTASFVSPKGLVVTNHHCAYGTIQYHSTPENNLLEKGFLARAFEEELPAAPGQYIYVTVEFRDVTPQILQGLAEDLSGEERYREIDRREKKLVAECEAEPGYRCRVASYYGGLNYSLVRQLEIRDVRLVYAPPGGIGVFGGDIDNWMWPRHTGDFSFYRAYVGSNGKPADHDPANVPYHPEHFLKVSSGGLEEGDLVMVAGYPGSTGRYRLASEVKNVFEWSYPRRVQVNRQWLEVIESVTADRPQAAIKYASLKSGLNNVLKNNQGMLDGFSKSDMLHQKAALEEGLLQWIDRDSGRRNAYGQSLQMLKEVLEEGRKNRERDLLYGLAQRSALLSAARRIYRLAKEKEKSDLEREQGYQARDVPRIRQSMERMDRTFDPDVDRAIWRHFILAYHELPADSRIAEFDQLFALQLGTDAGPAVDPVLNNLYQNTRLIDQEARLRLLEVTAKELEASEDPFIQLAVRLYDSDLRLEKEEKENSGRLQLLRPRYMEALLAFQKDKGKTVYPDANGTLRVTYGTVKGYQPADAVVYLPFTTLDGILEKDTGKDPFNTPPATLEQMRKKQSGPYVVPSLGSVPVNFLSTCDTTGGNSGSATLNGRAELVGLLFDGNYESMISDWDYLPDITRSIHVDMRYVLWLMDKVDQAHHLLEEMEIRSGPVAYGSGRD